MAYWQQELLAILENTKIDQFWKYFYHEFSTFSQILEQNSHSVHLKTGFL